MKIEMDQRRTTITLFVIVILGFLFYGISVFSQNIHPEIVVIALGACLVTVIMLMLYLRGWEAARYSIILILIPALLISIYEPYLTHYAPIELFFPMLLALILTRPQFILLISIIMYLLLAWRTNGQGYLLSPQFITNYSIQTGILILARLVTDTALQRAEIQADQTKEALLWTQKQAEDLSQANLRMNEQLEQQQRLLDLVETLETPMVSLADGVMLVPIVGHLSAERADTLMKRLLEAAHTQRIKLIMIDIAGVTAVDTTVARSLLRMVQALRLLGCEVALSGISSSVAMTLSSLELDFAEVRTMRSPQEALGHGEREVGVASRK